MELTISEKVLIKDLVQNELNVIKNHYDNIRKYDGDTSSFDYLIEKYTNIINKLERDLR